MSCSWAAEGKREGRLPVLQRGVVAGLPAQHKHLGECGKQVAYAMCVAEGLLQSLRNWQ